MSPQSTSEAIPSKTMEGSLVDVHRSQQSTSEAIPSKTMEGTVVEEAPSKTEEDPVPHSQEGALVVFSASRYLDSGREDVDSFTQSESDPDAESGSSSSLLLKVFAVVGVCCALLFVHRRRKAASQARAASVPRIADVVCDDHHAHHDEHAPTHHDVSESQQSFLAITKEDDYSEVNQEFKTEEAAQEVQQVQEFQQEGAYSQDPASEWNLDEPQYEQVVEEDVANEDVANEEGGNKSARVMDLFLFVVAALAVLLAFGPMFREELGKCFQIESSCRDAADTEKGRDSDWLGICLAALTVVLHCAWIIVLGTACIFQHCAEPLLKNGCCKKLLQYIPNWFFHDITDQMLHQRKNFRAFVQDEEGNVAEKMPEDIQLEDKVFIRPKVTNLFTNSTFGDNVCCWKRSDKKSLEQDIETWNDWQEVELQPAGPECCACLCKNVMNKYKYPTPSNKIGDEVKQKLQAAVRDGAAH